MLKEYGRPGFYRHMAENMDDWAAKGLRLDRQSYPRMVDPQHPDIAGKRGKGGNSNSIYDWKPTHDMHEHGNYFRPPANVTKCATTVISPAWCATTRTFFNEVGADDANWERNTPDSAITAMATRQFSTAWELIQKTSKLLDDRIMAVREEFGTQGIWADSFKKYVSQPAELGRRNRCLTTTLVVGKARPMVAKGVHVE